MKSFALYNGQVIPAGVTIECPAHAIHSDDSVFKNAHEFDALRFYKLREKSAAMGEPEMTAQNQFVSVSKDSLTFGYGRHACPGRFFAGNDQAHPGRFSAQVRNAAGREKHSPVPQHGVCATGNPSQGWPDCSRRQAPQWNLLIQEITVDPRPDQDYSSEANRGMRRPGLDSELWQRGKAPVAATSG